MMGGSDKPSSIDNQQGGETMVADSDCKVPTAPEEFVMDAEKQLKDETRMAIMTPSSSNDDVSRVLPSTSENDFFSPSPGKDEKGGMETIEQNDEKGEETIDPVTVAKQKTPPSPLLSMRAAQNSLMVATDQVKSILGGSALPDESDAAIHDFDGLYTLRLASKLRDLYHSKTLCDITVRCGGTEFDFQKVILSCSSGYFRRLLGKTPSTNAHTLEFQPGITSETFDVLAESLYTGVIGKIDYESSIPLLKASFHLEVEHATEQCTDFLLNELDQDNCLEIWLAANFCSNDALLTESTAKIGRHLPRVAATELFLALSLDDLSDLLDDDGLQVPNEMVVYDAVIGWIKHDTPNREGLLASALTVVRFPFLSNKFLTGVVAMEDLVAHNHEAMHMYSKALRYKLAGKKFAEGEKQVKRRDHLAHHVKGSYERYQKEQMIKEQLAREAPSDTRSLEERLEEKLKEIRVSFLRIFQEHLLFNKLILGPLKELHDQTSKHIIAPIKMAPCLPSNKTFDNDGGGAESSKDALVLGPNVPHEESFFVKYFEKPLSKTPCIAADSDDEDMMEEEKDAYEEDAKTEGDPKGEQNPEMQHILNDSVWTKYEVKVQKPEQVKNSVTE